MWDNEDSVAKFTLSTLVFGDHQPGINQSGNYNNIDSFTIEDVTNAYRNVFSPHCITISIVGDIKRYENLVEILENTFGRLQGDNNIPIPMLEIQSLLPLTATYYMNRDLVTIYLGGLSISWYDRNYAALLLYDINLFNRLLKLRDKYGTFYHFGGTLFENMSIHPGYWTVYAACSRENVQELHKVLYDFMMTDIDEFGEKELIEARDAFIIHVQQSFTSNESIASAFSQITYHGNYPISYHKILIETISSLSVEDIKKAVKEILNPTNTATVFVGRIGQNHQCNFDSRFDPEWLNATKN
jgi:predicted Zn-dependent peptidase